ncbi:GumC family protein [Flagellimonas zhangzhouensis]|uniref:non-specific protein-tyrosine kinase n=1 Tax=Flagellimonas zhangzhouensis TaxID=1073328 RepID=A0A1H2YT58_9FLAO|nr:tyrosine-protein kinase [Allomuricauda zhangzhouensis]SDR00035.1 capsular exopolysaccharide family [Allomuricauda zhangzhouensis]SDX07769.1 capsular exopolysaccharide family [Allomuricauda zhangzhouensis]
MSQRNSNDFSLSDEIRKYTKHWKWFVLSVIIGVGFAYLFVRYSTPKYVAKGKIKIVEEKSAAPGANLLQDIGVFSDMENNVEDEIEIITSRSNLIEVTKKLGLNTKVFSLGSIRNTELYNNSPITLNIIAPDSTIFKANFTFYLELNTSTLNFSFSIKEDDVPKSYDFGKNITTPIGEIVITPNTDYIDNYLGKRLKVQVLPLSKIATTYQNAIIVSKPNNFSNILDLNLEDPVKEKARDIINELVRIYNKNAIEDKQQIADRTSSFIDGRIADISSSLSSVDQTAEDFKTGRGVTDIASEANLNLNVGVANRQDLANAETQLNITSSMRDMVDQQEGFEVLPANLGLSDPTIANTTQQYNQLVQERNRLLESSNEKNPVIVNLDQQLNGLKKTMQASLNSTVNNLELQVNTLSGQQAIINSKIYSAPKNERALRDITRRQQTTESLYLYLLQKREEAQITVASTAPKSQVIDSAYFEELPVSPRKKIIYLAFGILGLFIPFIILYGKDLLDNKVHNMHTLENLVKNIPILGELPRLTKKEGKIITKDDRSVLAEALRIIRANMDYLLKIKTGTNNIVYVTSSVPGEGKTFLSVNLSMILASTKKKVLLIGGDVRNPKFKSFFTGPNSEMKSIEKSQTTFGLTDFLHDESLTIKDIVNNLQIHDNRLDVIYSGKIPPNPSELLMSDRLKELLDKMSGLYDYVIVDTAPMMMVSDTMLISEYANLLIYVTRADVTELKAVNFPLKLKEEGKIKSLSFVVNDVKQSNLGYGGKYGYGYGKVAKKWWKF